MLSKQCLQCNKTIYKKENCSLWDWNIRVKYCSKECSNKFRRGKSFFNSGSFQKGHKLCVGCMGLKGDKNPKWKGGLKELACKICKKSFMVKPYRAEKSKFCSINCRQIYENSSESRLVKSEIMRKRVTLGLHNFYRGITELKALLRQTTQYKQWRESIFIRDSFKCRFCGVGGKLNADHIKQFAIILVENNVKTLEDAINCLELWDMDNGQTLCIPCHKRTETYGRYFEVFNKKVEFINT